MDTDLLYKNNIGRRLTKILLDAYEAELLPQEKVSYLAGIIREELAKAQTSSDVFTFVEELANEYPVFASVLGVTSERPDKSVHRRYLEQIVHSK